MKTLSVKQPFAYLLCAGIKDIENRTWKLPEKYKGKWVLIHASAKPNISILDSCVMFSEDQWRFLKGFDMLTPFFQFKLGTSAIIGAVKYSDCVINHPSIWAEKSDNYTRYRPNGLDASSGKRGHCIYNWVVSEAILFDKPILNVKGKLSFWDFDLPGEYCKLLK